MNTDVAIGWFADRAGQVTYSMTDRNGPSSYDCSSSVYHALIAAGVFPVTMVIGNTDSLFGDLERHGFSVLPANAEGNFDTQRGDIFIWGARGASSGAAGHTGMFADADNIWNCNYGYNGIHLDNYDFLHGVNGSPEQTFYRYTGNAAPSGNQVDQIVEVGSWIKFDGTYSVNDLQNINNVWQVRTDQLCQQNFTWADNGIPVAALTEVDIYGFATPDQQLEVGSLYRIVGKFNVLDVGETGGRWLAQVGAGSMTFWVDIETATEIAASDPGTPMPADAPVVGTGVGTVTTAPTPAPAVEPTPAPTPAPVVEPVVPPTPEPVVETPTPSVEPVATPTPEVKRQSLVELLISFWHQFIEAITRK